MKQTPLVSAIIPGYNCAQYIERAINSVLDQTYPNIECIVVNDGSADETGAVARRFGSRITVIDQKNGGASAARNTGITHATGELIAFLDADDYWLPEKITKQVEVMHSHPDVVLVSTGFASHNAASAVEDASPTSTIESSSPTLPPLEVHEDFLPLFRDPYLGTPTVMVRRSRIDEAGVFDTTLPIAEDVEFFFRMCIGHAYARINETLIKIHHRPDSLCRTEPGYQINLAVIDRLALLNPAFHDQHPEEFQRARITLYERWAGECIYRGHGAAARCVLKESRAHGKINKYAKLYLKSFMASLLYRLRTGEPPVEKNKVMR